MDTVDAPPLRLGHSPSTTPTSKRFAVIAAGLDVAQLGAVMKLRRDTLIDDIAARRVSIDENIDTFVSWFRSSGHQCPLSHQLDRTIARGLPIKSVPLAALLYSELLSGVLLGLQDLHAILGEICFEAANDGETFEGLRGSIRCAQGEPVVRDSGGIIASVFQGPDLRTAVTVGTDALLFYVFDSPSLASDAFDNASSLVRNLMSEAGATPVQRTITLV